jgi:hypothetical protein
MWVPRGRPFFFAVVAPGWPRTQTTNQTVLWRRAPASGRHCIHSLALAAIKVDPEKQAIAEPHGKFSEQAAAEFTLAKLIVTAFF